MTPSVVSILTEMRSQASPAAAAAKARYAIPVGRVLGLTVPQVRQFARRHGKSQPLAELLWDTGIHEARLLGALVGEASRITPETMTRWMAECDSWDICDTCCAELFERTPHAWTLIYQWAASSEEFTRRAAFALIASLALHDKKSPDHVFLGALTLIEKYAFDDRNFVKKAVNWALRSIGKRRPSLGPAAIECALRIQSQGSKSARWIAADALRELRLRHPDV